MLAPDANVIKIPENTKGSACTALLAACQLCQDNDLLIVSANELVEIDISVVINDFMTRKLDAGTLIFRSVHPRYSYVRLNERNLVVEAAQQNPISQHATTGTFWYKQTKHFVNAAKSIIRKNASVANNFFVALTFNEIILEQGEVGVHVIENEKYRPLKTERQLQQFEQGAPIFSPH